MDKKNSVVKNENMEIQSLMEANDVLSEEMQNNARGGLSINCLFGGKIVIKPKEDE